ncbi:MAG TPA: hypothetical protein VH684_20275 [Xanthobacteraceae bacterium]|jgi:hypothetical protein
MPVKAKLIVGLGVALAPWLVAMSASADDEVFKATSIVTVAPSLSSSFQPLASFDISFVDSSAGVYLLADRSNKAIDVVHTSNNRLFKLLQPGFVGVVTSPPNSSGPNGVLTVKKGSGHTEVWAGDGMSRVWVVNLQSGVTLNGGNPISTAMTPGDQTRADELCYDPDDGIVMIANDASSPNPFLTFISTQTYQVLGHLVMNGEFPGGTYSGETPPTATPASGIEQCQYSPRTGKFYVNVPQAPAGNGGAVDLVLQIDPVSMSILNTVNITAMGSGCVGNHGMTIGPNRQIALGCNSGTASVIISDKFKNDSTDEIAPLPNENGTDENWYNPGDGHYFFANSGHTPPQLGVVDAKGDPRQFGPASEDTSAPTASGSHSVAADSITNQVYVPVNTSVAAQATKMCSTNGGIDANGCILVFTTTHDDSVAQNSGN